MKKIKFYKSALSLLTATSMLLMSGCTGGKSEEQNEKVPESCTHVTVYFENEAVTFKECDGYDIMYTYGRNSGKLSYQVFIQSDVLMSGVTSQYNVYDVYHDIADEQLNIEPIQKIKK